MFSDYLLIVLGLAGVFLFAFLYTSAQGYLQQRVSKVDKRWAIVINIAFNIGMVLLIGLAFYFLVAAVLAAVQGTGFVWGFSF